MNEKNNTIELVRFQLKPEISEAEGQLQLEKLTACVSEFPGFLGRQLSFDSTSKEWLDLVFWETAENAKYAAEHITSNPVALEVFSLINEQTLHMQHWQVTHSSIPALVS